MFKATGYNSQASSCATWNTRFAGKEAGYIGKKGYSHIRILGRRYLAHRLIWKMVHGYDPECIDHINRERLDNRLENLRNVLVTENSLNNSVNSRNRSGTTGVYWDTTIKRWRAKIFVRRKEYNLGRFANKADAIEARKAAEVRLNASPRAFEESQHQL